MTWALQSGEAAEAFREQHHLGVQPLGDPVALSAGATSTSPCLMTPNVPFPHNASLRALSLGTAKA